MGHLVFGKLAFVRNIIYVRLSPYEQKALPHFWSHTWKGFKRDFNSVFPYAGPAFLHAYLVYLWGTAENDRLKRKNPKDFENDV
ncbi:cytochrome b-c1 complex subunit 8-like [Oppia nitens]|uniref:cytochrome b-c1 complex subunit 8-like n=1 Tax=Oppia nitens TaxID=1686743 RepID=UPI0023DC4575|nr:cytochrome b-c1 complex subunit 8-like [Oppia nitens]